MTLKIIKYLNHVPYLNQNINGEKNSVIIGNSFIGSGTNLKSNVVIRGDGKKVEIGKNCIFKNIFTCKYKRTGLVQNKNDSIDMLALHFAHWLFETKRKIKTTRISLQKPYRQIRNLL